MGLLDFIDAVGCSKSASEAGHAFIDFVQRRGASVVHVFMETGADGFRATTLPDDLLYAEIDDLSLEDSHIVKVVRAGVPNVYWGVDLDKENPLLTAFDRKTSLQRHRLCRQRSSVTFAMPDPDGHYRGAGVGIGFEDRGDVFLNSMRETGGLLATASFATHSRLQLLLANETEPSPLSKRQGEILCLLARGHQLGAIADKLYISDSTVNLHLAQLKKKLKVRTKEQALALALTRRWIEP